MGDTQSEPAEPRARVDICISKAELQFLMRLRQMRRDLSGSAAALLQVELTDKDISILTKTIAKREVFA